jgi:signal transduction histidine kinase/ActR/RegA family two-component response regulator
MTTFGIIYLYSVPLIKQKVFEIERDSSRLALNNVFELAIRMYASVEEYQTQALNAHQQQLKVAVSITESYLHGAFRAANEQGVPLASARQQAFAAIRNFTYGNQDYVWIADYGGRLLSHPDPRFYGKDSSGIVDGNGVPVVPNIVKLAIRDGEGFYRYKWNRLAGAEPLDKMSYVRNYPEWGFVIGAGVYLDDIGKEVQLRKQRALNELRAALQNTRVAKTGYLFVFDSQNQVLYHPNQNIDRTRITNLKNPLTGNFIATDLIKVADTGQELHYKWDKPDDPGHYVYEKLSLVRYLKGFDWYICSSVYLDELRSSSETLSNRLLALALLTVLGASLLAYILAVRITRPLEQLANTAIRVSQGDLTAKSGIHDDDEIGILAASFDGMVERLKTNIDTLDTQVKQRTEELLETNARAQRMNAVGQLAGGLAHDFNNLLSVILGNLLLARDRYRQVGGLDDFLTPAIRASRRSADITQRLLAFSRRQPLQPVDVDVEQLMTETITLLRGSLPSRIELVYANETSPLLTRADPGHLENALVNLALNARDAMLDGGMLQFQTRRVHITAADGYDEPVAEGDYVEISVSDDGPGFSEEALKLAFEPFFSTKSGNTNSGLGLSMVYGFVKQSSGYIRISNQTGHGARITLLLPASQASTPYCRLQCGADKIQAKLSGKLFLLVEDNADVREVVRAQLIQLGLHVVEADDADEALQLIESLPDLDGMVSDIMLRGNMDGQQLAKQFYAKNPQSIILLISGYSYETSPTEANGVSFPLLHKPFDLHDLSQALWLATQEEENHENRQTDLHRG